MQQQPRGRPAAPRMFPRDAEFATAQLQGIVAELRADPALSPLLDDPKVAAAIKDIAANPAALQKHASNAKVMRVMQRLLGEQNLSFNEAAAFQEAGTSPTQVLAAVSADKELAGLLANPTVRTALAHIRANPDAGLRRWGSEPLVSRALDLLEQVLGDGGGGMGAVVDVVAEEVKQQQRQ
ncbi:hypothetical protein OEZ86_009953 [Tetradesmus obliquus]|uniref:Uncharacterized protein n=2 Tax=Tetradesmus obliquus TaxID=3088 RepID=A0ABY8UP55_TETOB|nr:hypothetical protein OEZ85_001387 [Tetradesmus obliquus]WIA43490.1 hypothetical protein OEZ86_009953 [Tetradesmus obliquus]|eukprot:jgi/Sobl393_1/17245/SZX65174.1